jgi:nitrate reductase gamma subunit
MREILGILLIITAYTCVAIFLLRILWRIMLLFRVSGKHDSQDTRASKITPISVLKVIRDVLFLYRLFRVNKPLWIGEWVFHCALLLVLLRHLRYFLYPVPDWVISIQQAGLYSGYVLPISLIYILIIKFGIEKKRYFSSYNFFLLMVLFLSSITGILMQTVIRADIVEIKHFVLSALIFKSVLAPKSTLFVIHFIISLIFLAYLPVHIFAAPYTLMDAQKREDGLKLMIYEN